MARRILYIIAIVIVLVLVCAKSVSQASSQLPTEPVRIEVSLGMTRGSSNCWQMPMLIDYGR